MDGLTLAADKAEAARFSGSRKEREVNLRVRHFLAEAAFRSRGADTWDAPKGKYAWIRVGGMPSMGKERRQYGKTHRILACGRGNDGMPGARGGHCQPSTPWTPWFKGISFITFSTPVCPWRTSAGAATTKEAYERLSGAKPCPTTIAGTTQLSNPGTMLKI